MAIIWQRLESKLEKVVTNATPPYRYIDNNPVYRAKVPGGWLIRMEGLHEESITFLPDPAHKWNGSSLR